MPKFDLFIAHSSHPEDSRTAQSLYESLKDKCDIFLDGVDIDLSDNWDLDIPEAQRASRITVAIVSRHTDKSYFTRVEIQSAISMSRANSQKHALVPVLVGEISPNDCYGLNITQGVSLKNAQDLPSVANRIYEVLKRIKQRDAEWLRLQSRGCFKPGLFQGYVSSKVMEIDYSAARDELLVNRCRGGRTTGREASLCLEVLRSGMVKLVREPRLQAICSFQTLDGQSRGRNRRIDSQRLPSSRIRYH